MRGLWDEVLAFEAPSDSLLSLLRRTDGQARSYCTDLARTWLVQAWGYALLDLGQYGPALSRLDSTLENASVEALESYGDILLEKRGIALDNLGDLALSPATPLGLPRVVTRRDSLRADSLYRSANSDFAEALRRYSTRSEARRNKLVYAEILFQSAYPLSVTGEPVEAFCRLYYAESVISQSGNTTRTRWLRSQALSKMGRIIDQNPDRDISSAYCTSDGHAKNTHGAVLNMVLWVGLYAIVFLMGLTLRAWPPGALDAQLQKEGSYLPYRADTKMTLDELAAVFTRRTGNPTFARRLAILFRLLFETKKVADYLSDASAYLRGQVTERRWRDNAALYSAAAIIEEQAFGYEHRALEPANTLAAYLRGRFQAETSMGFYPKSPLEWRQHFVRFYADMLPALGRYYSDSVLD